MIPQLADLTQAHPAESPDLEGNVMLIHEALARSRMQEARRAAQDWALFREATAGRRWERLARFAARRAEAARSVARREVGVATVRARSADGCCP
ncbi:MAG: hypothetical protein L0H84_02400 [Pseudonocardia sp.]|nr:hypothetical protein [Pseudonocardia sp.]